LLKHILTFDGAYTSRFIRCSNKTLSNHAFGTAFDINAGENPSALSLPFREEKVAFSSWFPRRINSGSTGEDIFHAGTGCISKLPNVSRRLKSTSCLSVSKLPRAESDNLADLGGGPKSRALNQATSGGSRIFGSRLDVARASPQVKSGWITDLDAHGLKDLRLL